MNTRKRLMMAALILVLSVASVLPASAGAVEGCSPGFWKNHLEVWPTSPNRLLNEFFGPGAPFFAANFTLWQAVNLKGGGINPLARQAAAAVLNILHNEVDYFFEDPPGTDPGIDDEPGEAVALGLLSWLILPENYDALVFVNTSGAPGFC